tara:strand:- start:8 stop:304 length:297 start_codon:yes stop_codon:yes gene_type:complete
MTSINISLTKEAYNFLKMLKGNDKSFSEVIIDLKENRNIHKKGSKEHLLKFWGALEEVNWDEREKTINEVRKSFDKRVEESSRYMEEARKEIADRKKK